MFKIDKLFANFYKLFKFVNFAHNAVIIHWSLIVLTWPQKFKQPGKNYYFRLFLPQKSTFVQINCEVGWYIKIFDGIATPLLGNRSNEDMENQSKHRKRIIMSTFNWGKLGNQAKFAREYCIWQTFNCNLCNCKSANKYLKKTRYVYL